jgi:hypothetical protein
MNRPCPCGSTPTLTEKQHDCKPAPIHEMRLVCDCGKKGAVLYYTKPEDRLRMVQTAWDGWNLGGSQ